MSWTICGGFVSESWVHIMFAFTGIWVFHCPKVVFGDTTCTKRTLVFARFINRWNLFVLLVYLRFGDSMPTPLLFLICVMESCHVLLRFGRGFYPNPKEFSRLIVTECFLSFLIVLEAVLPHASKVCTESDTLLYADALLVNVILSTMLHMVVLAIAMYFDVQLLWCVCCFWGIFVNGFHVKFYEMILVILVVIILSQFADVKFFHRNEAIVSKHVSDGHFRFISQRRDCSVDIVRVNKPPQDARCPMCLEESSKVALYSLTCHAKHYSCLDCFGKHVATRGILCDKPVCFYSCPESAPLSRDHGNPHPWYQDM